MNEHHKSPYTDAMNGNKLWEKRKLALIKFMIYYLQKRQVFVFMPIAF